MSLSRRDLVGSFAAVAAATLAGTAHAGDKKQGTSPLPASGTPAAAAAPASGPFVLPALPYADTDLAPAISQNTLAFHYGKHHQGYLNKLNELVAGKEWADKSLEAVMKGTYGTDKLPLYNNSAQVWNHTFYWQSMKKGGGGAPGPGKLSDAIKASFGDGDGLKKELTQAAVSNFGSGWAWLVQDAEGKLKVLKTSNADNPVVMATGRPLLTIDVWEHAYYLDYQNKRAEYVAAWLDKLVNWSWAESQMA